MKRFIATATLLALSGAWATAQAQEQNDKGFYVGAGVGQFNVKINDVDDVDNAIETLDDSDTSWKGFVGYRFNPYIGVEIAYIDFGAPSDHFDTSGSHGEYKAELSGFAPYLVGTLPLGPVELFAKVGYYYYDVKASVDLDNLGGSNAFNSKSSEEDFLYGGGVGVTFFQHLHTRLEYEKIDSSSVDKADALWLSAAWRF